MNAHDQKRSHEYIYESYQSMQDVIRNWSEVSYNVLCYIVPFLDVL